MIWLPSRGCLSTCSQYAPGRDGAQTPRQKDEENEAELNREDHGRCAREHPVRQLHVMLRERGWQRLRPKVIVERSQVAPRRDAGDKRHGAGEEQKAENEPTIKTDDKTQATSEGDREK